MSHLHLKTKTSGFAGIALMISIALISVSAAAFTALEARIVKQKIEEAMNLGATVYTTQLSDTFGTFRNQVNSSTANLNTQLNALSSTVSALGTMSTVNSPAPVANGGTGTSTTPANSQFLIASGTTPTWKTLASSTGITLAFNSTTVVIGTTGFDNTANINFTGNNTSTGTHTFQGTSTFTSAATTTFTSPVLISSSARFNVSTTFAVAPAINTTATLALDATNKNYVDLYTPRFLASSTPVNFTAVGTSIATNTFTLANEGIVISYGWGTYINNTNNDGCKFSVHIDNNTTTNDVSSFKNPAAENSISLPVGVTYASRLSAGLHTINLYGGVINGGNCTTSGDVGFYSIYLGQ